MSGVLDLLSGGGLPLIPVALIMLTAGLAVLVYPAVATRGNQGEMKRRLRLEPAEKAQMQSRERNPVHERAVRTTQEFYAKGDPKNVAKLRHTLIRAGYMDPGAVGTFFLIRFAAFIVVGIAALAASLMLGSDIGATNRWVVVGISAAFGYFLPGLVLSRIVAGKTTEYRNGFPDFMDLMIVCSDAGMSMEAGIDRVSRELALTYPTLSKHLQLLSIELRVGRSLDEALRALGDRLSLDEVRAFATLLRQSKELGTSLSGALRVFSDEMRHKRMSRAEEKAHALPAKMSIPVTVCILPVVMMVAITPIIVKVATLQ